MQRVVHSKAPEYVMLVIVMGCLPNNDLNVQVSFPVSKSAVTRVSIHW